MKNSTQSKDREELLKKMVALSVRQQAVLAKVYEQVPEQAKEAVQKAIENSQRGHEQATQELKKTKDQQVESLTAPGKGKEPNKGQSQKEGASGQKEEHANPGR
jgi:F0F1-type ATP synthase membrane subunit b/b'